MTRLQTCFAAVAALTAAGTAQAQIRNAPGPRALEFAAYVFAASNVCGFRIDTDQFEALLVKQNTHTQDIGPRGPFGTRVQGMFALMSNDMALHRDKACPAVAGEYGPEGTIARNLLIPAAAEAPATAPTPDAPAADKPMDQSPAEAPAGKPPQ